MTTSGQGSAGGGHRSASVSVAVHPGDEGPVAQGIDRDAQGALRVAGVDLGAVREALGEFGASGSVGLPGSRLDPRTLIALLRELDGLRAALSAVEARTVVALEDAVRCDHGAPPTLGGFEGSGANAGRSEADHDSRDDDDAHGPVAQRPDVLARIVAREVSVALRRSPAGAARLLATSRRLVRDLPRMLGHLSRGEVTPEVAHAVARAAGPVDAGRRGQIDAALSGALPHLEGASIRQWQGEVDLLAHELDPHGAARRHERARRERGVTLRRTAHGMATISVTASGIDAALVRKRLSLEAERLTVLGDRRGHQQIMADALVDTVIGRSDQLDPVTLDIGIIVTERGLLAPAGGDAATVEGYGVVPLGSVRSCLRRALEPPERGADDPLGLDGPALRAVYRRLWTHPTTGELVAVESTARTFPAALRRAALWRDGTCRAPFCEADIRQIDHVRPHARGGPTSWDNANGLCAACNQKESFTRDVVVERRVRWVTRYGQEAVRGPIRLVGGGGVPPRSTGVRLSGAGVRQRSAGVRQSGAGVRPSGEHGRRQGWVGFERGASVLDSVVRDRADRAGSVSDRGVRNSSERSGPEPVGNRRSGSIRPWPGESRSARSGSEESGSAGSGSVRSRSTRSGVERSSGLPVPNLAGAGGGSIPPLGRQVAVGHDEGNRFGRIDLAWPAAGHTVVRWAPHLRSPRPRARSRTRRRSRRGRPGRGPR